jgi:hypothetical protein
MRLNIRETSPKIYAVAAPVRGKFAGPWWRYYLVLLLDERAHRRELIGVLRHVTLPGSLFPLSASPPKVPLRELITRKRECSSSSTRGSRVIWSAGNLHLCAPRSLSWTWKKFRACSARSTRMMPPPCLPRGVSAFNWEPEAMNPGCGDIVPRI